MTSIKTIRSTKDICERDFLYHGLPCIWDGSQYIIFSPYALKIAHIGEFDIDASHVKQRLETENFFGRPAEPEINGKVARVGLIVSTHCNLRCEYCYSYPNVRPINMTSDYARRILQEKVKSETEKIFVTFYGGEPSLNMKVVEGSVSYIEETGKTAQFLIITNGTADEKKLDYLIEKKFAFIISSDGVPDVTDGQRGNGGNGDLSGQIERTIKRLVDAGAIFQVRATLTKASIKRLSEGIRYWSSLGAKFIHFEPESRQNVTIKNYGQADMSPDEYVKNVCDALDEAEKAGIWIISSPYMNLLTPSTYFCTTIAGEKELYAPDGSISACYQVQSFEHPMQELVVGKYDQVSDSFEHYENNKAYLKSIKVSGNSSCMLCVACYICAGGCPLRNKLETGVIVGNKSWMCFVKKSLMHDAILRIDKAIKERNMPVVFGESIFEDLVTNNPSIIGG